jgi:large conductance mechanosensitive channel
MLNDFKKFIARGNVLDMAVGIIIGAAFTTVVKSMVDDILMPPIGRLTGGVDFSNLFIDLSGGDYATLAAAEEAGAATINYGLFVNAMINFLIVAAAVFLLVRAATRMVVRERAAGAPPAPTEMACPHCKFNIPIGAQRCGHCTQSLSSAAV